MKRWKKKDALERLGLVHAAGWVFSKDKAAFDELVETAKPEFQRAIKKMEDNQDD